MSKLVDVHVAARKLDVSESTVRRMLKDAGCKLIGVKVYKGCVKVKSESIEEILSENIVQKNFHL